MLVGLLYQDRHIRDASGASMFGPASGEWLAWWADAVSVMEIYTKQEHNARTKAEMSEMSQTTVNNNGR